MTAHRSGERWLTCNGWYGNDSGYHDCTATFTVDPCSCERWPALSELRKLAVAAGWACVPAKYPDRLLDMDQCPRCKASEQTARSAADAQTGEPR